MEVKKEYIGKKVLCIKPCIMVGTNKQETTKGKKYKIINVHLYENSFDIIDDSGDQHGFIFKDKYFKVSALLKNNKMKNIDKVILKQNKKYNKISKQTKHLKEDYVLLIYKLYNKMNPDIRNLLFPFMIPDCRYTISDINTQTDEVIFFDYDYTKNIYNLSLDVLYEIANKLYEEKVYGLIDSYYIDDKHILHTFIGKAEHVTFTGVYSDDEADFLIDEENAVLAANIVNELKKLES